MHIDDFFPSKYVMASDLQGQHVKVTISHMKVESVGQGADASKKPVLYFHNAEKGLVLNKTNGAIISEQHGGDPRNWPGKQITLFSTKTDFQGKRVDAIRVLEVPVTTIEHAPLAAPAPAPVARPSMSEALAQQSPAAPAGFGQPIAPREVSEQSMNDAIPF